LKILITGVAGFIGYHIAARVLAEGHFVIGVDNLNGYYDPLLKQHRLQLLKQYENNRAVELHVLDICDQSCLRSLFRKHAFSAVIHMAAQAGVRYSIEEPRKYIETNIGGFFNVLDLCKEYKVPHLIYASSSSVYGGSPNYPYRENDDTDRPLQLYAATKKSNELMAYSYSSLYGMRTTGLRFFTVYGPLGRPDMAIAKFVNCVSEGKQVQLYNYGDHLRDFTYVDDVTSAMNLLLCSASSSQPARIYNIGRGHPESLEALITHIEEAVGKRALVMLAPPQPGDTQCTYSDSGAFASDFGFEPTISLRDGIGLYVDWYRQYYDQHRPR